MHCFIAEIGETRTTRPVFYSANYDTSYTTLLWIALFGSFCYCSYFPNISATCKRDIIFMVEDSSNSAGDNELKLFLINLVNSIPIGDDKNRVAVALFNYDVHVKVPMARFQNATHVSDQISNIRFSHTTNGIDYKTVVEKISEYTNSHRNGDRANVSDAVIIVSDHGLSAWFPHIHHDLHKPTLHNANVIAVNVGSLSVSYNYLQQLATDSHHIFDIPDYHHLTSIETNLTTLICE